MIITRKKYNKLTREQKMSIEYSNPCSVTKQETLGYGGNVINDDYVRVGEVLDSDLGHWRDAFKSDF